MNDSPRRRFDCELRIHADTERDLASSLYDIARRIDREGLRDSVSGGVAAGFVLTITEDESMTPSRYQQELIDYLAAKHEADVVTS